MLKYTFLCQMALLFICSCNSTHGEEKNDTSLLIDAAGDTVKLFAEHIISNRYNERDMAISVDGVDLFFSLGTYNQRNRAIIHLHRVSDHWSPGEIMPWSGTYNDIEPFLSPDGSGIYFASDRPVFGDSTRKDYNLWFSKRDGDRWGDPVALDSGINTRVDEFYPSLGKSNNLYFTAAHEGNFGREDIYLSKRIGDNLEKPMPLDSNINSATYEFNAYISPSEDTLFFSSYGRKDDLGGGDLYMSTKDKNGTWIKAQHLGNDINSPSLDYCPFIDFPRQTFYFTSNRSPAKHDRMKSAAELKMLADATLNGYDNIYCIKLDKVK